MSKTGDLHATIQKLEGLGYSVSPPRSVQRDFQLAIGRLLQSFQFDVQKPFERDDVTLPDLSRFTLTQIRDGITEILEHAKHERKAAAE